MLTRLFRITVMTFVALVVLPLVVVFVPLLLVGVMMKAGLDIWSEGIEHDRHYS